MKYFSTLPQIITSDGRGGAIILTNLMARASLISSLFNDPLLFYSYDIQEGDTPEIIAHKYYEDIYRYWIVLVSNQIVDPQWDWPMSGSLLANFIEQKYGMGVGDIHHFEKTTTQFDINSQTETTHTLVIDQQEYDALVEGSVSYTLPTGTVSVITTKRVVTNYDYELEKNETKRSIKLLNKDYVPSFESQFKKLMS